MTKIEFGLMLGAACGHALSHSLLTEKDVHNIKIVLEKMGDMLDEAASEDFFGTEGWEYLVFAEE